MNIEQAVVLPDNIHIYAVFSSRMKDEDDVDAVNQH